MGRCDQVEAESIMAKSIKKKLTRKSLVAAAARAEAASDKLYRQRDILNRKLGKLDQQIVAAEERCSEAYGAVDAFDLKPDLHQSPFANGVLCPKCKGTGLA